MTDSDKLINAMDALDHILRTAKGSRTSTRRIRWIEERAKSAINGDANWRDADLPKKAKLSLRESKMQTFIDNNISEKMINWLSSGITTPDCDREIIVKESSRAIYSGVTCKCEIKKFNSEFYTTDKIKDSLSLAGFDLWAYTDEVDQSE